MAKKKARDLSLDNALIQALPEDEYVKNPLSFSQIRGDFSLSQTNLMIGMVAQMQDKIEGSLSLHNGQMMLFQPEDMNNGMLQIEIPLNQLGIIPQRYGDLEAAVDGLMDMKMTYKSVDERGIEYDTQRNIFYEVSVPTETKTADGSNVNFKGGARRKGVVKIKIYEECVKDIFNMKKGYIEHLKGIARLCRCSRTPRLYIYLSAWRKKGHYNANFNDLKEFLGVLAYNKERTKIIKNQYEKFSVFTRDVLNPVQEEMKKLAQNNLIEFYFEYEPIYKTVGKKRGNPDMLAFTLIATQKGIDFDANKRIEKLHSTLISTFHLQPEEWEKFAYALDDAAVQQVSKEIFKILEAIEKNNVTNTHAYATAYIMKMLGIAESQEVDQQKEEAKPVITQKDLELWDKFVDILPCETDEVFCNVFMSPCSLHENRAEYITIMVPTSFVAEQLMKQQDGILRAIRRSFGAKSFKTIIDPEYH